MAERQAVHVTQFALEVAGKGRHRDWAGSLTLQQFGGGEFGPVPVHVLDQPLAQGCQIAGGDAVVKVWDFIYAGSSDHFYRLHIGSVPHLDAVIPAAIRPGEKATLTLLGRNLPGGSPCERTSSDGKPLERLEFEIELPAESSARRLSS